MHGLLELKPVTSLYRRGSVRARWRGMVVGALLGLLGAAWSAGARAQVEGVTDTEVIIGQSCQLSGPLAAGRAALANAGVKPEELDLIVLATTTPDNTFPATATKVRNGTGLGL